MVVSALLQKLNSRLFDRELAASEIDLKAVANGSVSYVYVAGDGINLGGGRFGLTLKIKFKDVRS